MTEQEKIERYKRTEARWEEEYRCYGPRGTIKRRMSGMTRAQINKLRKAIRVLEARYEKAHRQEQLIDRLIRD